MKRMSKKLKSHIPMCMWGLLCTSVLNSDNIHARKTTLNAKRNALSVILFKKISIYNAHSKQEYICWRCSLDNYKFLWMILLCDIWNTSVSKICFTLQKKCELKNRVGKIYFYVDIKHQAIVQFLEDI